MKPPRKRLDKRQKLQRKKLIYTALSAFSLWLLIATHLHLVTGFGPRYVTMQVLLLVATSYVFFVLYRKPDNVYPKLAMYVYLATRHPLKIFAKPALNKHNSVAVIARHKESVGWVRYLDSKAVIYNKGETDLKVNCQIIPSPNQGYESETYMRYIIDNYHSLPEFVIFLLGNPFDHCWSTLGRIKAANGKLQLLGKTCEEASFMLTKPGGLMNKLTYQILPESSFEDRYKFVVGAQFIVPRELIVNKSLTWWQHAYSAFVDFDAIIALPPESFGEPLNGRVFERIWPLIWEHCSEQDTTR